MKKCLNCNSPNNESAKFCKKCGNPLTYNSFSQEETEFDLDYKNLLTVSYFKNIIFLIIIFFTLYDVPGFFNYISRIILVSFICINLFFKIPQIIFNYFLGVFILYKLYAICILGFGFYTIFELIFNVSIVIISVIYLIKNIKNK